MDAYFLFIICLQDDCLSLKNRNIGHPQFNYGRPNHLFINSHFSKNCHWLEYYLPQG